MRPGPGLAALALVALTGGCGSGGSPPRAAGPKLFAENCAICHSINGRPSPRQQGGDLLTVHTTGAQMLEFVREMPVRHPLSSAEIEAVADYVRAVEARGH